jgi:hypothetical protein
MLGAVSPLPHTPSWLKKITGTLYLMCVCIRTYVRTYMYIYNCENSNMYLDVIVKSRFGWSNPISFDLICYYINETRQLGFLISWHLLSAWKIQLIGSFCFGFLLLCQWVSWKRLQTVHISVATSCYCANILRPLFSSWRVNSNWNFRFIYTR